MEVLRKLQLFRQIPKHIPSISSSADLSPTLAALLRDLKAHLSSEDFLDSCAEDSDAARDTFKMLDLLSLPEVPTPISRFLIEFEAFCTRFSRDLSEARAKRTQWTQLCDQMEREWDQSLSCKEKATQLHSQRQSNAE